MTNNNFVIDDTRERLMNSLVKNGKHVLLSGKRGSGKTKLATLIAQEQGRPFKVINMGSTQDARSALLGNHSLVNGNTDFNLADFAKGLQVPNNVLILDELSRASDAALNIILPILDFRQSVFIEEINQEIKIAPGVSFIATANIGPEYSATRSIDLAVLDRFIQVHLDYISGEELGNYILSETGSLHKDMGSILKIYDYVNREASSGNLQTELSPRTIISCLSLLDDGFTAREVFQNVLLSVFQLDSSILDDVRQVKEYADSEGMFDDTLNAKASF